MILTHILLLLDTTTKSYLKTTHDCHADCLSSHSQAHDYFFIFNPLFLEAANKTNFIRSFSND